MGPKKKVKKTSMKSKPLKKGGSPLKSILKKKPSCHLKKGNLTKLGEMSLAEKVKAVTETHDNDEDAVNELKGALTPDENSQVWGQRNTFLKKNPLQKEQHDALSRKEKGLASVLWYLQKSRKTLHNVTQSMEQKTQITKKEKWLSEKMIHDRFNDWELECHLNSGRVIWRNDPLTRGLFEYQDLGDFEARVDVSKSRKLTAGQEYDPNEADEEAFLAEFDKDNTLHLKNAEALGKGEGKGKAKGFAVKVKGKALGKVEEGGNWHLKMPSPQRVHKRSGKRLWEKQGGPGTWFPPGSVKWKKHLQKCTKVLCQLA